jgi:hypothetical protein
MTLPLAEAENMSLHAVLARLGWSARDGVANYRRVVRDERGETVGEYTAHECWSMLRERGLVR